MGRVEGANDIAASVGSNLQWSISGEVKLRLIVLFVEGDGGAR